MSGLPTRTRHYQNAVMNSAKWDSFIPRPDDIIITTSYKAGTTWLQGICAALVFQQISVSKPTITRTGRTNAAGICGSR